jgi:hypothetical protein
MSTNNSLLPTPPQLAPYKYGGNPNQEAAGRMSASDSNQVIMNKAFMGGKVKRRSLKKKKRRSLKKKNRKSLKKRKGSKRRRFNKRGGATTYNVPIVKSPYPSASGGSQNVDATQLRNGGNNAQSIINSKNDVYATKK